MAELIRQYIDGELADAWKNNDPGRIIRFHMDEGHPGSDNEVRVLHHNPNGSTIVDLPKSKMAHIVRTGTDLKISDSTGCCVIIDNIYCGSSPNDAA